MRVPMMASVRLSHSACAACGSAPRSENADKSALRRMSIGAILVFPAPLRQVLLLCGLCSYSRPESSYGGDRGMHQVAENRVDDHGARVLRVWRMGATAQ